MPIYEYDCRQCLKGFEQLILSTREAVKCPRCASSEVERRLSVFSAPGNRTDEAAAGSGCSCTPATCGCR